MEMREDDTVDTPWEFGGLSQESHQLGLTQQSFGLSQSQSQLDCEIGLSQYGFSQRSQIGSQGESAAASKPTCMECQSREIITTDGGDMVCAVCGTAYEGNINEVAEASNELMSGVTRRRRFKVIKEGKNPRRTDDRGWPVVFSTTRECLEGFQLALHLHVKAFCALTELSGEAAAEVRGVASEVWFSYLERLTLPPACGHSGVRVRDDFRTRKEIGTIKSRARKGGADHEEAMGPVNVDERKLLEYGGDNKVWRAVIKKARRVPGYTVPPLCMALIPAILCVCARWMRSPILAVDVVRWIRDGSLPYKGCLMRLPAPVRMRLGKARHFFMARGVPAPHRINNLADRVSAMLGLELPPLNVPAVARTLANGMGMPAEVLTAVEALARFSVGNPSAPNPATALTIVPLERRRVVMGKKKALTSSESASGVDGISSDGRGGSLGNGSENENEDERGYARQRGDTERGVYEGSGPENNDGDRSSSSGESSDSSSACDEANDVNRARKKLRRFLSDASPLHVMALVVAAAKSCPGWDSWKYARPALLPTPDRNVPPTGVPVTEAGFGARTGGGEVEGASQVEKRGASSSQGCNEHDPLASFEARKRARFEAVGAGAGEGEPPPLSSPWETFRAPFCFPAHPGELRLLLRGRLPEYLRRVEEGSGGAEFGGSWLDNAGVLPPMLEGIADEMEEKRRRQHHNFRRDRSDLPPRSHRRSEVGALQGEAQSEPNTGLDGGSVSLGVLMGAVRAAHVVAGVPVAEKEEGTIRRPRSPPTPSNSGETRSEPVTPRGERPLISTAQGWREKKQTNDGGESGGGKAKTLGVEREKAGLGAVEKRGRPGKVSSGRETLRPPPGALVYDPDDPTSRFHPQYELLVEACACYVEVPPYLLQEQIEKLDRILVDQAVTEDRRSEKHLRLTATEGLARRLLRREGRLDPEQVELRGVFDARESAISINQRFFFHRREVMRKKSPHRGVRAALLLGKKAYRRGFDVETPRSLERSATGPGIVVMGGGTLRPSPLAGPLGCLRSVAATAAKSEAEEAEEAAVEGYGKEEEGRKKAASQNGDRKDEEVRWLLHSVGAGSDPFVDDEYTEGVGRGFMFKNGIETGIARKRLKLRAWNEGGKVVKGRPPGSVFEGHDALLRKRGAVDARDELGSGGRQGK